MSKLRLEMAPGRAVERLMEYLGLSKKELADALNATPRTLERRVAGGTYPQPEARRRLAELDGHLRETFDDREAVRRWLRSPDRYLGGLRPCGRGASIARVEAALEALDSGVFV